MKSSFLAQPVQFIQPIEAQPSPTQTILNSSQLKTWLEVS
jgi:hypothetical protein